MAKLKTGRHTSALKEARKSKKRQQKNISIKSKIKTLTKKVIAACESKNFGTAKSALNEVFSVIDKAAKKKIIHKNTAARRKAKISKKVSVATKSL